MNRGVHRGLRRIVFYALLLHATILEVTLSSASMLTAATFEADKSSLPQRWIHNVQSEDPLPLAQRDVLEQLMQTPMAPDLKVVFELYLNRNRKLSDKDFQTFSKILETANELKKLEEEQQKTNAVPTPPKNSEVVEEQTNEELASSTKLKTANDNRSSMPDNSERPPPSIDLDFLYHGMKPMRPL